MRKCTTFSRATQLFCPAITSKWWYNIAQYAELSNLDGFVRLEVFTAVTMKNGVFWDVMPCGSHKNRRFGGT
jgi:hypothetical protein